MAHHIYRTRWSTIATLFPSQTATIFLIVMEKNHKAIFGSKNDPKDPSFENFKVNDESYGIAALPRLRWLNHLDSKLKKASFTKEEEDRLLMAHHIYRTKWSTIATLFPSQSGNVVKK
ncbi:Transcription factor CSA, partial [Mucuna pruriens]